MAQVDRATADHPAFDEGLRNAGCSSRPKSSSRRSRQPESRPSVSDCGCRWRGAVVLLVIAASSAGSSAQGRIEKYSTWCGDDVCEPRIENFGWCSRDCFCGDGVCDDTEAVAASCPKDCLSHVEIAKQPSSRSPAAVAFYDQPVVRISASSQADAYTPGK